MAATSHLTPAEQAALEAFVRRARELLGSDLIHAKLFGSRARGEGDEQSDLDVALVVTPRGRARRGEIYDLAFDVLLAHGVEVAPAVIESSRLDELRRRERLIALDLDREGIAL